PLFEDPNRFWMKCCDRRRLSNRFEVSSVCFRCLCLNSRMRLSCSDLCAATKCHILINHQPVRFDITMQCATRLEFAEFSHENIALHRSSRLHRFRPDVTAYARVLPNPERSGGIDCALHLAVDEHPVQEFDRALIETPRERRAPDC